MDYSLSELTSKYESLWDQQNEVFCEMSKIKNRIEIVEYSNAQLITMEQNMRELHTKIHTLNKKIDDIIYIVDRFKVKTNITQSLFQYYYNIFIVIGIVIIYNKI